MNLFRRVSDTLKLPGHNDSKSNLSITSVWLNIFTQEPSKKFLKRVQVAPFDSFVKEFNLKTVGKPKLPADSDSLEQEIPKLLNFRNQTVSEQYSKLCTFMINQRALIENYDVLVDVLSVYMLRALTVLIYQMISPLSEINDDDGIKEYVENHIQQVILIFEFLLSSQHSNHSKTAVIAQQFYQVISDYIMPIFQKSSLINFSNILFKLNQVFIKFLTEFTIQYLNISPYMDFISSVLYNGLAIEKEEIMPTILNQANDLLKAGQINVRFNVVSSNITFQNFSNFINRNFLMFSNDLVNRAEIVEKLLLCSFGILEQILPIQQEIFIDHYKEIAQNILYIIDYYLAENFKSEEEVQHTLEPFEYSDLPTFDYFDCQLYDEENFNKEVNLKAGRINYRVLSNPKVNELFIKLFPTFKKDPKLMESTIQCMKDHINTSRFSLLRCFLVLLFQNYESDVLAHAFAKTDGWDIFVNVNTFNKESIIEGEKLTIEYETAHATLKLIQKVLLSDKNDAIRSVDIIGKLLQNKNPTLMILIMENLRSIQKTSGNTFGKTCCSLPFLEAIISSDIAYRNYLINNEYNAEIGLARTHIFRFIDKFLEFKQASKMILESNKNYIRIVKIYLHDKLTRSTAAKWIKEFFQKSEVSPVIALRMVSEIFVESSKKISNVCHMELIRCLIRMLVNLPYAKKSTYTENIRILGLLTTISNIPLVYACAKANVKNIEDIPEDFTLKSDAQLRKCIYNIIHLFSFLCFYSRSLQVIINDQSRHIVEKLEPLIKFIEMDDNIKTLLINFIVCGQNIGPDSNYSKYLIYNTEALWLLNEWSYNTKYYQEFIDILHQFCSKKNINRYQAFKARIFPRLMDFIINNPFNESANVSKLFTLIGSQYFHKNEVSSALQALGQSEKESSIFLMTLLSSILDKHDETMLKSYFYLTSFKDDRFVIKNAGLTLPIEITMMIKFESMPETDSLLLALDNENFHFKFIISQSSYCFIICGKSIENRHFPKEIKPIPLNEWLKLKVIIKPEKYAVYFDDDPFFVQQYGFKFDFKGNTCISMGNYSTRSLPKNGNVINVFSNCPCYFEDIVVKQRKTNIVFCNYTANLVDEKKCYNLGKTGNAVFRGIVVQFSPTFLRSILSCGGPIVFLPLILTVTSETSDQYIVNLFNIIQYLITQAEDSFLNQGFFKALNYLLRKDKNIYRGSVASSLISLAETITIPELKDEMIQYIWSDLPLINRIQGLMPTIYQTHPELNKLQFIDIIGQMTTMGKVSDMNKICPLLEKESYTVDELIVVYCLLLQDKMIMQHKVALEFIQKKFNSFSNVALLEPLISLFNKDDDIENMHYAFQIILSLSKEKIYNVSISLVKKFIYRENDSLLDFILLYFFEIVKTLEDISKNEPIKLDTDEKFEIRIPELLPFVIHLITMTNDAKRQQLLMKIYNSPSVSKITQLPNWAFYLLYMAHFCKDKKKWIELFAKLSFLFRGSIENLFIELIYCIKLFNWDYEDISTIYIKYIIENCIEIDPMLYTFVLNFLVFNPKVDCQYSSGNITLVELFHHHIKLIQEHVVLASSKENNFDFPLIDQFFSIFSKDFKLLLGVDADPKGQNNLLLFELVIGCQKENEEKSKNIFNMYIDLIKSDEFKNTENSNDIYQYIIYAYPQIAKQNNIEYDETPDENIKLFYEAIHGLLAGNYKDDIDKIKSDLIEKFKLIDIDYSDPVDLKKQLENLSREIFRRKILYLGQNNKCMKHWNTLKNQLEMEAIGYNKKQNKEKHFKIDQSVNNIGGVIKLKKNKKYKDHLDASRNRDKCDGCNERPRKISVFVGLEQNINKDIIETYPSLRVKIDNLFKGVVNLLNSSLIFEARSVQNSITDVELPCHKFLEIQYNSIHSIFWRRYRHLNNSIEIMTHDGHFYFFEFVQKKVRTSFLTKLEKLIRSQKAPIVYFQTTPSCDYFPSLPIIQQWKDCEISNYEYLFWVNMFGGRSFNDLSQYPVFPWIISDYSSETIDLSDPSVYRDLTKPMGAQNPERLKALISKKKDMEGTDEYCLYRSHYSTSAFVLHYLVRCEPFTSVHIDLAKNKFDDPGRIFTSLKTSYHQVNMLDMDYRELIPQFFTLPEFLINANHFDLGVNSQTNVVNDDVVLPPWAKTASQFIAINRLALESPITSSNLNRWIDLIFGYQTRGKAAEEAYNDYHPYCYSSIMHADDNLSRAAIAREYAANMGIIPEMIFKNPHPKRNNVNELKSMISKNIELVEEPISIVDENCDKVISLSINSKELISVEGNGTIKIFKRNPSLHFVQASTWKIDHINLGSLDRGTSSRYLKILGQRILYSAPWSNTFSIYNIIKKKVLFVSTGFSSCASAICGDKDTVVVGTRDSVVSSWDCHQIPPTPKNFIGNLNSIVDVSVSQDLDLLASCDINRILVISIISQNRIMNSFQLPEIPIRVFITTHAQLLIVYDVEIGQKHKSTMELRDLRGNLIETIGLDGRPAYFCFARTKHMEEFILISYGYEKRSNMLYRTHDLYPVGSFISNSPIGCAVFNPDDSSFIVTMMNGKYMNVKIKETSM